MIFYNIFGNTFFNMNWVKNKKPQWVALDMKILMVRPPRYLWPWNSESSSFWQPLGFASMAAVLRANGFDVGILDCLVEKKGWASLQKELKDFSADVVCLGDETASAHEAIRLAGMIKEKYPSTIVVGGGYFFTYKALKALQDWGFDYIVRGEGEQVLLELVAVLAGKKHVTDYITGGEKTVFSLSDVYGLSYLEKGTLKETPEQEPVDMDLIPLPAYDLLPMGLYGVDSSNHKDYAAIEHGRGCSGGCSFCSINALYSHKGRSCYRTKSARRSFEETRLLVEHYGRKTLNWVDGTFNLDPRWNKEYFDLLKKHDLFVNHTAWMRADCIVRDEKQGILKQMVDMGLVQSVVGMERLNAQDNDELRAQNKNYQTCLNAFRILRNYSSVYTIATLIYGMPDDGRKELKDIKRFIYRNVCDFQFILPFTPYPGTELWEEYASEFTNEDFISWNLHRPVMGTKKMTREQLDWWFKGCLLSYIFHPTLYVRAFMEKDERKRCIQRSLTKKLLKGLYRGVIDVVKGSNVIEYGKKPEWYDK